MTTYTKTTEKAYARGEEQKIRQDLKDLNYLVGMPRTLGEETFEIKNEKGEVVGTLTRTERGYKIDTEDPKLKEILDGMGLETSERPAREESEEIKSESNEEEAAEL